jgi:phospholipid transport system substrate-binding protein
MLAFRLFRGPLGLVRTMATLGLLCAVLEAVAVAAQEPDADAPALTKARRKLGGKGDDTPPSDSSPLAELRNSNTKLRKLLAKQPPSWSPENDARNSDVRKMVDQFLDFEELARRSLARHWDGLSPRQRTEFVSTLRDLVDRNYLRELHGKPEYELKFDKETKTGNEGEVHATLFTANKGKKVTVDLIYRTIYKGGHWAVYDVVTDDQSLLENYRAEFNKIIEKDGFDALLKRMRRKLNEKTD